MNKLQRKKLRADSTAHLEKLSKELRLDEIRIQVESKPDRNGDQRWTLFWRTFYIPGHPDGEWRDDKTHVKVELFYGNLEKLIVRFTEKNRIFSVDNSRIMGI